MRLGILSRSAIGDNHGTVLTAHFHSGWGRAGWHDDKHWNTKLWGMVSNSHGKVTVRSHDHPLSLLILKNSVDYCTLYSVTKLFHMILDHSDGLISFFSSTSWSYYDTIYACLVWSQDLNTELWQHKISPWSCTPLGSILVQLEVAAKLQLILE